MEVQYYKDLQSITINLSTMTMYICFAISYLVTLIAFTLFIFRIVYRYWNYIPLMTKIPEEFRKTITHGKIHIAAKQ